METDDEDAECDNAIRRASLEVLPSLLALDYADTIIWLGKMCCRVDGDMNPEPKINSENTFELFSGFARNVCEKVEIQLSSGKSSSLVFRHSLARRRKVANSICRKDIRIGLERKEIWSGIVIQLRKLWLLSCSSSLNDFWGNCESWFPTCGDEREATKD